MNTHEASSAKTARSSGLLAIMQKELRRFFTDRRMVLTTVLLPGLLIFLVYSFIGGAITSNLSVGSDYVPHVYAVNLPSSLATATTEMGLEFEQASAAEVASLKEQVANKTVDLLVVFPEDFDKLVLQMMSGSEGGLSGAGAAPEVALFYNSTRVESAMAYSQMQYLLNTIKQSIQPIFSVNTRADTYDLASQEDTTGLIFASLLPILLMIFLYTGCIAVAPESIAGEKERGTIATLLVTPLKRWELALGKILSLCIIALLSGASSFIGVMLSLPKLMNAATQGAAEGGQSLLAGVSIYGVQDYLMLLAVIFSTVLLFVGLISIISAFARTVKEANTMVMPLMILILLVAASAMFQTSSTVEPLFYLIPAYNSVQSLVSVFSFSAEPLFIILTVVANCVVAGLCVVVLARMFESERVVFSK